MHSLLLYIIYIYLGMIYTMIITYIFGYVSTELNLHTYIYVKHIVMMAMYVYYMIHCKHKKGAATVTIIILARLAKTNNEIDDTMKWQHDKL